MQHTVYNILCLFFIPLYCRKANTALFGEDFYSNIVQRFPQVPTSLAWQEPEYFVFVAAKLGSCFHLAAVFVLRRLTLVLFNPNHRLAKKTPSIRAQELGFLAAVLFILSPDLLYLSSSNADAFTSFLVLSALEKFILSHDALEKPLWRRGLYRLEAGTWFAVATSSRPDLLLYALAFMIPMSAETRFLIGRLRVKLGKPEDPAKPPIYSAWFIMRQFSFHFSVVAGIILGALSTRLPLTGNYQNTDAGKYESSSRRQSGVYPGVFMGENPWYVLLNHI